MKQFIFIDILTNEKFVIKCEPYKIHSIELWNEDFAEWCNGRILKRDEKLV